MATAKDLKEVAEEVDGNKMVTSRGTNDEKHKKKGLFGKSKSEEKEGKKDENEKGKKQEKTKEDKKKHKKDKSSKSKEGTSKADSKKENEAEMEKVTKAEDETKNHKVKESKKERKEHKKDAKTKHEGDDKKPGEEGKKENKKEGKKEKKSKSKNEKNDDVLDKLSVASSVATVDSSEVEVEKKHKKGFRLFKKGKKHPETTPQSSTANTPAATRKDKGRNSKDQSLEKASTVVRDSRESHEEKSTPSKNDSEVQTAEKSLEEVARKVQPEIESEKDKGEKREGKKPEDEIPEVQKPSDVSLNEVEPISSTGAHVVEPVLVEVIASRKSENQSLEETSAVVRDSEEPREEKTTASKNDPDVQPAENSVAEVVKEIQPDVEGEKLDDVKAKGEKPEDEKLEDKMSEVQKPSDDFLNKVESSTSTSVDVVDPVQQEAIVSQKSEDKFPEKASTVLCDSEESREKKTTQSKSDDEVQPAENSLGEVAKEIQPDVEGEKLDGEKAKEQKPEDEISEVQEPNDDLLGKVESSTSTGVDIVDPVQQKVIVSQKSEDQSPEKASTVVCDSEEPREKKTTQSKNDPEIQPAESSLSEFAENIQLDVEGEKLDGEKAKGEKLEHEISEVQKPNDEFLVKVESSTPTGADVVQTVLQEVIVSQKSKDQFPERASTVVRGSEEPLEEKTTPSTNDDEVQPAENNLAEVAREVQPEMEDKQPEGKTQEDEKAEVQKPNDDSLNEIVPSTSTDAHVVKPVLEEVITFQDKEIVELSSKVETSADSYNSANDDTVHETSENSGVRNQQHVPLSLADDETKDKQQNEEEITENGNDFDETQATQQGQEKQEDKPVPETKAEVQNHEADVDNLEPVVESSIPETESTQLEVNATQPEPQPTEQKLDQLFQEMNHLTHNMDTLQEELDKLESEVVTPEKQLDVQEEAKPEEKIEEPAVQETALNQPEIVRKVRLVTETETIPQEEDQSEVNGYNINPGNKSDEAKDVHENSYLNLASQNEEKADTTVRRRKESSGKKSPKKSFEQSVEESIILTKRRTILGFKSYCCVIL